MRRFGVDYPNFALPGCEAVPAAGREVASLETPVGEVAKSGSADGRQWVQVR